MYWHAHYFLHGEVITFGIGLPLMGLLAPIIRSRVNEIGGGRVWPRARAKIGCIATRPGAAAAKSIDPYSCLPGTAGDAVTHHQLVARLDYPNFECVVIINNTRIRHFGSRSRCAAVNLVPG